jgi:hypothetical protein
MLHARFEHGSVRPGPRSLAVDDSDATESLPGASDDEVVKLGLGLCTGQAVQIDFRFDAETAAAEISKGPLGDAGPAKGDFLGGLRGAAIGQAVFERCRLCRAAETASGVGRRGCDAVRFGRGSGLTSRVASAKARRSSLLIGMLADQYS